MTAYQEKRIHKLEMLLQKAEKICERIAADSFIYTEKYYECNWCGSDVADTHYENCLCLTALDIRLDIERTLRTHKLASGG